MGTQPYSVAWTPDETHLSYFYLNKLWAVRKLSIGMGQLGMTIFEIDRRTSCRVIGGVLVSVSPVSVPQPLGGALLFRA